MNIAAIMKKFKMENSIPEQKKHDRDVLNMQMNTLLEPNNFIPQWEAGGEEKREVSVTLKLLRQKFDKVRKLKKQKEDELRQLQTALAKAGEEEIFLQESRQTASSSETSNQTDFESLVEEHDFEKLTQCQYEHMLKRMKQDLISSQLRS